jgi:spore maturation protein CgeB
MIFNITAKPYRALKVALVSDDLTRTCLSFECKTMSITPWNYLAVFQFWKPDILFVETTWRGRWNSWRYKMARYPHYPERTNQDLARVVAAARAAKIPTVFWNREDGIHFDRFIDSAKLFDHVLSVDKRTLPRYREALGPDAKIDVMMFAASERLHKPRTGDVLRRASFVGSYSSQHAARKQWQDKMFLSAEVIGLTVYDRNSARKPADYRYPSHPWIEVRSAVPYARTAEIYQRNAVNLNVNTITNSPTAFSRRLVEIIATGSLALTNVTPAVSDIFANYCIATDDAEEARQLFESISRDGLSKQDAEKCREGADYVMKNHTWRHRLEQILDFAS